MAKLRLCVDKRRRPLHASSATPVPPTRKPPPIKRGAPEVVFDSLPTASGARRVILVQAAAVSRDTSLTTSVDSWSQRQADGARGTGGRSAGTTKQSGEHLTVSTVAGCCTRSIRRARPSSFKLQPGCHASCEVSVSLKPSQKCYPLSNFTGLS